MRFKLLSLVFFSFLFGCRSNTRKPPAETTKNDTAIHKPEINSEDIEDRLSLDTIKYNQVLLNNLQLQTDTATAIKNFGAPSSKNIYAFGTCYRFGDASLCEIALQSYFAFRKLLNHERSVE